MGKTPSLETSEQATDAQVYGRTFWLSYLANVILVMANALTFRFAELVRLLGGGEDVAGDIVSLGLTVAVLIRLSTSHLIDDYGTRRLWPILTVMFIAGASLFLLCRDLGPLIYVARMLFVTGLTGMFACSMTHIQNVTPISRRTEIIGNLGSSGFIGMVLGSNLGDWILKLLPPGPTRFIVLFGGAAVIGVAYLVLVLLITADCPKAAKTNRSDPAFQLLYRHFPGMVTLVAMVMGLGVTVTTVFLTRFATSQNIEGIGAFFTGYAISAFVFRITAQNWSSTIGRNWMIVRGLTGHAIGHAMLPWVSEGWHFVVPAMFCGFGHALLFPAVVSLGSGAFPKQSRGAGTATILAMVDFGSLVFSAFLGRVIVAFGFPAMFAISSGVAAVLAGAYVILSQRFPDGPRGPEPSTNTVGETGSRRSSASLPLTPNP